MKKVIKKYKDRIVLTLAFSVCFSYTIHAQVIEQDTVSNNKIEISQVLLGEQPNWKVTGSVSTVKGEELQKGFNSNLGVSLIGRLPGLTVQQFGAEPGYNTPGILSRGIGTFKNNKVLVIIDGFEGDYENLVPDEIESISLLKDASATAIYGSRAANGVLLVTTKRGENQPLKVRFSLKHGFQSPVQLPEYLGSYDYALLYNEALTNDGKAELYSAEDMSAYKLGSDPYFHPDVNWNDELLRKRAGLSNYGLSFTGGSENVRYFVALNAISNGGIYKRTGDMSDNSINSDYNRYNVRSNIDVDLNRNLTATLNLSGSVENKSNPGSYRASDVFSGLGKIAPNAFPVYNPNGSYGGSNINSNPLGDLLELGFFESNARRFQSTFKLTEKLNFITEGLSVSGAISFNNYFKGSSSKIREYERFAISKNSTDEIVYNKIGQNTSLDGVENASDQWRQFALRATVNYERTFNNHAISGLLLAGSDNTVDRIGGVEAISSFPYKHNNYGGRFTYAFSNKYIAEFSFGINGSENFHKDNRYGFFPASSLGWVISNEEFLKGNSTVTFLKLKGSYGLVGNDIIEVNRFSFKPVYNYSGGYTFGTANSVSGMHQSAYPNANVTWEKSKMLNVGLEVSLLNRIDFSLEVFKENRYDIIGKPYSDVPGYLGLPLPDLNIGEVSNKGFETMIRYTSSKAKSFQYVIEANAWYAKNTLDYYSEVPQLYDWQYRTGNSVIQPFGYEAIGLFQDQAEIDASPKQNFSDIVLPGDIKYRDMNNDNVIDDKDIHAIGKSNLPELNFNLHVLLKYKGFDIDALFHGISGTDVYLGTDYYKAFQNNGTVSPIALGRWNEATKATASYPRLSSENNRNNFGTYSSYWQQDGDYIKLRSLELGYTLSDLFVEKLRMDNVRFFVNGTNLFSIDKLDYSDPEIRSGYPAMRTISIGTTIQF